MESALQRVQCFRMNKLLKAPVKTKANYLQSSSIDILNHVHDIFLLSVKSFWGATRPLFQPSNIYSGMLRPPVLTCHTLHIHMRFLISQAMVKLNKNKVWPSQILLCSSVISEMVAVEVYTGGTKSAPSFLTDKSVPDFFNAVYILLVQTS